MALPGVLKHELRGCKKNRMRGFNSKDSAAAKKLRIAFRADPGAPFFPRRPVRRLILGQRM